MASSDDAWNALVCEQFRFNPPSSDIIEKLLKNKIVGELDFGSTPIVEVDMYGKGSGKNPWELFPDELPWQRGDVHGKKLFVFTVLSNVGKTHKSSNKQKSRVAGDGSWRVNGKEKPVFDGAGNTIGYRRALTFRSNKQSVGHWNMDEFSIEPAAFPQELGGHELECQNLVLCRISFKNQTEDDVASSSKKRKSAVLDDDSHSCMIDGEGPSDFMDEASSSKRQKVCDVELAPFCPVLNFDPNYAVPQEQAPDYFNILSDSDFVDTCINFDHLF